ncbi:hypothetical protein FSP39_003079 [Pinctada imbricata]|uniref:Carbonyl reductase [NADPH] 1-like n=1 Tax=Pinctada imbricata TaxID=66713 RepID=A0AA88YA81_PINIB|nr:hypothetical protein FSP39_003079 [Pinctada imbricata]
MAKKVAIVTGANRGLGLEILRQLLQSEKFQGDVYLTSRMTDKGREAAKTLEQYGLNPCFHELDITQPGSIRMFEEHLVSKYGGVDIIINNAAVTYTKEEKVPLFRQAQLSMGTDFKGTLNMCRIFWPHIRPHGRIVLLTNGYIANKNVLGSKILERLNGKDVTFHTLITLMDEYMKAVQHGLQANFGWPESPSQIAKIFIVELAKILCKNLQGDRRQNVLVNACCPGWTQTDGSKMYMDDDGLCNGERPSSVSESAKDVVWLATLPPGTSNMNGLLVRHRHVIDPTAE